ncbi:hypothetical protein [Nocardia sp. CY41]|uniref:hypothetical protein n=1 Tax=Nocardia sp. CY41 TaxID=2608686 RepID=UPI001359F8BE|nr:hypothetical protein [Nocardia sp. CY41]
MTMRDTVPALGHIRRMRENPALNAAFAALGADDEYTRAFRVAEQAEQRLRALTPAPNYSDAVADILDAGQLPADFGEWLREHNTAQGRYDAERQALTNLRTDAAARCWAILTANPGRLLTNLHQQLTALIDQASASAAVLGDITDAEDIVRAGHDAVQAFGALDQAHGKYIEIRSAQQKVMRECVDDILVRNCRSDQCNDKAATDAYFANLDELYPGWRRRPGQPDRQYLGAGPDPRDGVPWPQDGPMQLAWFINHGAEFWVPTPAQLEELHKQRRERNYAIERERTAPDYVRDRMRKERETGEQAKRPRPGPEQLRRANVQRRMSTPGLVG